MKIEAYKAGWSINQNKGRISLKIEGEAALKKLSIDNAAEFTAILTILQGDSTASLSNNGWITTTEEEDWL